MLRLWLSNERDAWRKGGETPSGKRTCDDIQMLCVGVHCDKPGEWNKIVAAGDAMRASDASRVHVHRNTSSYGGPATARGGAATALSGVSQLNGPLAKIAAYRGNDVVPGAPLSPPGEH